MMHGHKNIKIYMYSVLIYKIPTSLGLQ